jgi:hypothetical protein
MRTMGMAVMERLRGYLVMPFMKERGEVKGL